MVFADMTRILFNINYTKDKGSDADGYIKTSQRLYATSEFHYQNLRGKIIYTTKTFKLYLVFKYFIRWKRNYKDRISDKQIILLQGIINNLKNSYK